jgi:serine protease Do
MNQKNLPLQMLFIFLSIVLLRSVFFSPEINSRSAPGYQNASIIPTLPQQSAVEEKSIGKQLSDEFEAAAAKLNPVVVPVFTEQMFQYSQSDELLENPFRQFFGDEFYRKFFDSPEGGGQELIQSMGSGVIVSEDGYILTNNHVIQGADKIIIIVEGKQKMEARLIGTDPQSDLAVIQVETDSLPVAKLGNSDEVNVGQLVIAVGNPFQLLHTVTAGIISAKGRSSIGLATYEDFIQTDASINPGNSGGALADLDGNVIGINTAISTPTGGSVGIGFAIPINMAKEIMNELIKSGKISRGYLGILPQDIDGDLAKAFDLQSTNGSLVGDVTEGGPADMAGLRRGDIIQKIDGQIIKESTDLRLKVAQTNPGSTIQLDVLSDGKLITIPVVLTERPNEVPELQEKPKEEVSKPQQLGMIVRNLSQSVAEKFGYENEKGILVVDLTPGLPAYNAGLEVGDLLIEMNKKSINSINDLNNILAGLNSGGMAAVLVKRKTSTFYVAIPVP